MRGQIITIHGKQLIGPIVSIQIGVENTVLELKQKLAAAMSPGGTNSAAFRLVRNQQKLKLTDQLCHYDINDNDTVMIIMKLGHTCNNLCQTPGSRYFHQPPYHADPEK